MGKQTDAIVYYCDKCRKSVVGSPGVVREAESLSIAHGIDLDKNVEIEKIPFHASKMNKFILPELAINSLGVNPDGSADVKLDVEAKTKYLCRDCAKDIVDDYVTWCSTISELF